MEPSVLIKEESEKSVPNSPKRKRIRTARKTQVKDGEPGRKFLAWKKKFEEKERKCNADLQQDLVRDTLLLTERLRTEIVNNQWTEAKTTMDKRLDLDPVNRRPAPEN